MNQCSLLPGICQSPPKALHMMVKHMIAIGRAVFRGGEVGGGGGGGGLPSLGLRKKLAAIERCCIIEKNDHF